jgi:hypothetical protein
VDVLPLVPLVLYVMFQVVYVSVKPMFLGQSVTSANQIPLTWTGIMSKAVSIALDMVMLTAVPLLLVLLLELSTPFLHRMLEVSLHPCIQALFQ